VHWTENIEPSLAEMIPNPNPGLGESLSEKAARMKSEVFGSAACSPAVVDEKKAANKAPGGSRPP
jgi:hypothetical protein